MSQLDQNRLLDRFLRYVLVDTTAVEGLDRYPSSDGQLELGKMLVDELRKLGVENARQDERGLIRATLSATSIVDAPRIVWNAHLDTSPETTGAGVKPQVIRNYAGGDLVLPGDSSKLIRVADNPELDDLLGCTLVTTDGTTLLGGDDKAGVAVIMEVVAYLGEHPEIEHGPIEILFTCDEEIGRGVEFVDVDALHATAAYTLDGPGADSIDVETFSADLALLTVRGVNIHPAIAKDRMVNAIRAAADFVSRLPRDTLSPESTDGRDGFLHPYVLDGGVAEVRLKILLRDFDSAQLVEQAALLRLTAQDVERAWPGTSLSVDLIRQYRNMNEGLAKEPRAVRYVQHAYERIGRTPELSIIRGGTDGSQFTERGLPTPNLSTGQHNPHSPLEWACLDEMAQAGDLLLELAKVWCVDPGC